MTSDKMMIAFEVNCLLVVMIARVNYVKGLTVASLDCKTVKKLV